MSSNLKQRAAERAVEFIQSGMKVGLGTGSTVQYLLDAIAERLRDGRLADIACIPTSEATAQRSRELGIPLTTFDVSPQLDVTIDGADEVSPDLSLIKGLGGALLREKIVAAASHQFIIMVDETKRVERLGTRSPLPVEVIPLGWNTNLALFEQLGATPILRTTADGSPYVTDNHNYIVDCHFADGIDDATTLARALDAQPGVVGHGLFLDMADCVVVSSADGIVLLER